MIAKCVCMCMCMCVCVCVCVGVGVHMHMRTRMRTEHAHRACRHVQACELLRALVGLQEARGGEEAERLWSLSMLAEAARGTDKMLARWAGRRLAAAERR